MKTEFSLEQLEWLYKYAQEEMEHRRVAYPKLVSRGKMRPEEKRQHLNNWALVLRLLYQATSDAREQDPEQRERPSALKYSELIAARAETAREWRLRRRFYSDKTLEGKIKLTFCIELIRLITEQMTQRHGTQTTLF